MRTDAELTLGADGDGATTCGVRARPEGALLAGIFRALDEAGIRWCALDGYQ